MSTVSSIAVSDSSSRDNGVAGARDGTAGGLRLGGPVALDGIGGWGLLGGRLTLGATAVRCLPAGAEDEEGAFNLALSATTRSRTSCTATYLGVGSGVLAKPRLARARDVAERLREPCRVRPPLGGRLPCARGRAAA
jgi:hypothetical protein